jgi:hypothetical protein
MLNEVQANQNARCQGQTDDQGGYLLSLPHGLFHLITLVSSLKAILWP